MPTISTSVTHITDAGPVYCGVPANELLSRPFEDVATPLIGAKADDWEPYAAAAPEQLPLRDRIRCVAARAGSFDPLRSDREPAAVAHATGRLISTMGTCLGSEASAGAVGGNFAEAIARRPVPGAQCPGGALGRPNQCRADPSRGP